MICLADNDIVKKLAICNLLDEALNTLGVSHREILVLPTARFKLGVAKNPDKARSQLGSETFDRLKAFLDRVGVIDVAPPPEEQQLFNDALEIDTGEAILFPRRLITPGVSFRPVTKEACEHSRLFRTLSQSLIASRGV